MQFWAKLKIPTLALVALVLASFVVFLEVEASDESDELVGASAVWLPAPNQLSAIQGACRSQLETYSQCFLEQMTNSGASDDAVAFAQNYADQHRGTIAFLNGFRPVDAVDVGYAFFPLDADFQQRWLLLNGVPAIIDVDDLALLPHAEMEKDPAYRAVHRRYPRVTVFDGDRSLENTPAATTLADGQSFTIDYPLKDGCRACALLGQATFAFNFDESGQLDKVRFVKITLSGPHSETQKNRITRD